MSKETFHVLTSTAVPLPIENIDTDQIIPARFLKATTREGFGDNLFRDWRFTADNEPIQDFVLNNSRYAGAEILVAGKNFGMGSSREHAAWAIHDYGFRVVVSSFFADIFRNNALNTFVLPVQVSQPFLEALLSAVEQDSTLQIVVDLPAQTISFGERSETFAINTYKKTCLMNGYDDIDYLLSLNADIREFDQAHA
ncbi:3-isopropylmalate dehydratase small subunit [Spirosoma oryzae]|uniref:3-isopropylmalate dehydratase small subunit n=1 Tax=Spirosoma oryzae TaxID=1469603 RepID=A0A2T0ST43_9BACT|nr:3-isopropylmalate dehydratase small subunit [Spirosoma oryzae]PRY36576.1 3-isopropylmalate dehydratase small subunit [Spirosoma oryzae]